MDYVGDNIMQEEKVRSNSLSYSFHETSQTLEMYDEATRTRWQGKRWLSGKVLMADAR